MLMIEVSTFMNAMENRHHKVPLWDSVAPLVDVGPPFVQGLKVARYATAS